MGRERERMTTEQRLAAWEGIEVRHGRMAHPGRVHLWWRTSAAARYMAAGTIADRLARAVTAAYKAEHGL